MRYYVGALIHWLIVLPVSTLVLVLIVAFEWLQSAHAGYWREQ